MLLYVVRYVFQIFHVMNAAKMPRAALLTEESLSKPTYDIQYRMSQQQQQKKNLTIHFEFCFKINNI